MGLQTFYDKGPHPLMWARSRAARGKTTVSDTLNHFKYCVIFIVHTHYKCGRGPRVGDPYNTMSNTFIASQIRRMAV